MTLSGRRAAIGALVGLLAAGVALAAGELTAAFVRPAASPIIVVGNRLILATPEGVKRWAIRQFGSNDKHVLLTGIYVGIALVAVAVGIVALWRLWIGLVALALLGAAGCYAALTTHAHRGSDTVPSVVAALAGLGALWLLHALAVSAEPEPERAAAGRAAGRRRFLQAGLGAAGLAAVGGFGGRALQHSRYNARQARAAITLPTVAESGPGAVAAAGYDLGKSGVPFQTAAKSFYRIDTALTVPQLDPAKWRLRIHGMVDHPLTLTYADLVARPVIDRTITLTCVSNEVGGPLMGNAVFRGVRLADLLREAGVSPAADQLFATSSDGMTIGSPTAVVMDGRDAMLAFGMNGEPLPIQHGFPVRMVVPGLYGYVSACKWLVDLEATTFADQQAYWVQGGWAQRAPIRLSSRIDAPRSNARLTVGTTVAVAGVAWDQHVGVSTVQVRIDQGDWQPARLAAVPSTDTWRQWVYLWTPSGVGPHTLTVRAVDAAGNPQDETKRDAFPAGATGLHSITVRAR